MLDELKRDTQHLHDKTEEAMNSTRLMNDDYSQQEYSKLLLKLHSALQRLTDPIYDCLKEEELYLDLYYRLSRKNALELDLKALGHKVNNNHQDSVNLHNTAEAWGALYVLEGSSLGSAMIYKSLQKRNWPADILNYYGYYGVDTGPLWKKFKEEYRRSGAGTKNYPSVLKGAEKAYGVFIESGA